jgi:GNAT superfamily N-acetyltransferase
MSTRDEPGAARMGALGEVERWRDISAANLARYWEHPVRAAGGRWARWDDVWAADDGAPTPFLNSATLLRPVMDADAVDALVARLADFYGGGSGGSWMLWSAWPTPDLGAHGMHLVGHPPLMVRPPGGEAPPAPPELEIVEVSDAEGVHTYGRVFIDGYPIPEFQPAGSRRLFDPRALGGPFRLWIGSVAGEPVSVAGAYVGEDAVSIYAVATLPHARGKGYGAALTARALGAAPHLPAELQASDDGRPVYLRLGFTIVTTYALWVAPRPPGA